MMIDETGGDASTRFLAATQDEGTARLKDSSLSPAADSSLPTNLTAISRGRDGYSLLGVLRTKPGRADSPPTICMSCSDKIASWNVHGIQGALGSLVFQPLYISTIIIGEVPKADDGWAHLRQIIEEDCERALWTRVADVKGQSYVYSIGGRLMLTSFRPRPSRRIYRAQIHDPFH